MTSRRRGRSSGTRDIPLRAAREFFLAKGYAEATVADLVTASGINAGSLYHHFGGKPGLFPALCGSSSLGARRSAPPGRPGPLTTMTGEAGRAVAACESGERRPG
ncbi:helix-turn-helix domain-containing protein [Nonomuraea sp. B12E4]|uniref:helix-turn-helix domain-containing protein n=1 Tax=Nonomuraea sp. B12E4 TaxID=3153564 RepID=UPI00325E736D